SLQRLINISVLRRKARKEAIRAEKILGVKFCSTQIENQFGCPAPNPSQYKKYKKHSSRFKKSAKCTDCASKPFKPRRKFFRRKKYFPKNKKIECFICKGNHYSWDCPKKGHKASAKAKVSFVQEHSLDEDTYVLISDTESYESNVEFSELIVATNQVSASSSEDEFSDSDQGYDSLPSFHCNMICSSYEHPFIAPSSIVLKQKLDTLQQELSKCPPHMVNHHYSLQAQIYELQNQLDAKIQQENHEDTHLASQRSSTPTTSFAPYQFSLPSGRGRGHLPRQPAAVSHPVPAIGTPERKWWRQARISLLERAIQKATEEFQSLLQEEESANSADTEEDVDRLIMEKAYDQYDAEHQA
ncbi:hypothetical protein KI387_018194, partial [Taxus chinensis]